MLPAPVAPLLDPSTVNLKALEAEMEEVEVEIAAAAAAFPSSSLPGSLEDEIKEEVEEDPSLLPAFQATPLFAPHELRNESEYDEATGTIAEGPKEERPVSPLELFFDLFFAALLAKLGHTLAEHLGTLPGQVLFYYVITFQLVYQNWLQVTSFVNRYASESTSDKLFVGWNLMGLGGVSINVSRCMGSHQTHDCSALAGWMAFGRSAMCVWFFLAMLQARRQHREKSDRFSRISFATNLVSVLLLTTASVLYQYRYFADGESTTFQSKALAVSFLVLTVVLDVVQIPALWFCLPFYRRSYVPVNSNLAAERFGLVYIVSLGELVLSAVSMDLQTHDTWPHVQRATVIMMLGVLTGLFFQSAFFSLYDLQADHAKKHALEVSVLRGWAILHVTSFLALLASLVAAVFARLSLGLFTPTDRLTLWLTLVLKICLFSGSNLLYLRHVRVAYGWVADLSAIFLLIMLGMVLPELMAVNDVVFVALAIAMWGGLMMLRGVILPVRLTQAGVEEVHTLYVRRARDRKWRRRRFGQLPFIKHHRGASSNSRGRRESSGSRSWNGQSSDNDVLERPRSSPFGANYETMSLQG